MSDAAPIDGLKAIAHPLRFRIMSALASGERNVGEIEAASGIGQPALSQQLATLRKAALVTTRREAKQVFYSIEADTLDQITQAIGALQPQSSALAAAPSSGAKSITGAAVFARLGS